MLQDCGPFRRKQLANYMSQMSTPNPNVVFDDHVASILEQQGFSWDEDPRSVYEPEQLYASLRRYATDWSPFERTDTHMQYGFSMAYKIFAKPKDAQPLSVLTDDQVVSQALKLSKSSGIPLMTSKAESLTYSFDREVQVRQGLKAPNPCVGYKRTQAGNKTRLVWGFPLEMTIMESRFARPLIDVMVKRRTPMAFGMTKTELGAVIHRYVVDRPGVIVALDYSGYDTTISKTLIKEAFRIIGTWFTQEDREEYGYNDLISYFIRTPIVMPDGHLYRGKEHGVPSGSYFTQMVDSIINVILSYALASRFGFEFTSMGLLVLGDDVLMNVHTGVVDLAAWANYLGEFGLKLNVEKSQLGVPHFLGAIWDKGKPDADIQSLVNKAVFPENFRLYGVTPDAGAEAVLRSYASNYLSAYRLLPLGGFRYCSRTLDFPSPTEVINPTHLSGSDRYLLEESKMVRRHVKRAYYPTLSIRLLE